EEKADKDAEPLADGLENAGEEGDDWIKHCSPSLLEAVEAQSIARLVPEIRVFERVHNMTPPDIVEAFVVPVERVLVEHVARDEIEGHEIRDQPVGKPRIGMIRLC